MSIQITFTNPPLTQRGNDCAMTAAIDRLKTNGRWRGCTEFFVGTISRSELASLLSSFCADACSVSLLASSCLRSSTTSMRIAAARRQHTVLLHRTVNWNGHSNSRYLGFPCDNCDRLDGMACMEKVIAGESHV